MKVQELVENVRVLATEVGGVILAQSGNITADAVEVKGLHDFVTYVDKEAEQRLVRGLREILPEAGFITEEDTASTKGDRYTWVVDPLDGTKEFIEGVRERAAPHSGWNWVPNANQSIISLSIASITPSGQRAVTRNPGASSSIAM